jgi:LPS export ABC transporter permease LptG/LPS export ABC transporter permease LptF
MRTLDRYLARETLPPFLLALAVFTFVLAVRPMLDHAEQLLSKGVPVGTVGFLLLTLLPQALGLTLPMAFLAGLLMAFGRISADREGVAFLACGISPLRLLRPVLVLAVAVGGLTMYVLIEALPDANQKWREITFRLLAQQTETDIKPRLFYEGFPGKVLYYLDQQPGGGWKGVMLADTSQPGRPVIVMAEEGQLLLDRGNQKADIVLRRAVQYVPGSVEGIYDIEQIGEQRVSITPESVFGAANYSRGNNEMTIAELRAQIALKERAGLSPHNEIMTIHQKFSFPVGCLVFALLGLAFGLHTRKEGRLAGLALGLGVIGIYYVLMYSADAWTKGGFFPAAWARWVPNIVLGSVGLIAVWRRNRANGDGLSFPMPAWLVNRMTRSSPPGTVAGQPKPRHVVLVVRVPILNLPRPRLLDAYVSGRYLRILVLAGVGLLVLSYIGTFVDMSEKLFKGQATSTMLAQYLWYMTPQFVSYMIPIATLVAVLGTIGGLTRSSELTVMRACGVSLYRAAMPLVALALVWSGVLFGLEERVLGQANRKAAALEDSIRGRPPHTVDIANRHWLAGKDGRLYYYLAYDGKRRELLGLHVFQPAASPFRLVAHAFAGQAAAINSTGAWRAEHGWVQEFPAPDRSVRQSFDARQLDLEAPEDFSTMQVAADQMTFGELKAYISRLGASGFSVAEQRVSLHGKIAYPLVTLVMTVLGVPFAVTTGRRGALYGIGLAILLAIAYWLISAMFLAAGNAAVLPAALAAWATNILFLAAAGYLVLTVRT